MVTLQYNISWFLFLLGVKIKRYKKLKKNTILIIIKIKITYGGTNYDVLG